MELLNKKVWIMDLEREGRVIALEHHYTGIEAVVEYCDDEGNFHTINVGVEEII